MKQKERIISELEKDKDDAYEKVKDCQNTINKLKNEREGFINDNSVLLQENKTLQNNILESKQFMDNQKQIYEAEKLKDKDMIQYLQNTHSNHSSVQKARNPNMLDSRLYSDHIDFNHTLAHNNNNLTYISNKTADFHQSENKENTNTPNFYNEDIPSYGKITKNRNKSQSMQRY